MYLLDKNEERGEDYRKVTIVVGQIGKRALYPGQNNMIQICSRSPFLHFNCWFDFKYIFVLCYVKGVKKRGHRLLPSEIAWFALFFHTFCSCHLTFHHYTDSFHHPHTGAQSTYRTICFVSSSSCSSDWTEYYYWSFRMHLCRFDDMPKAV